MTTTDNSRADALTDRYETLDEREKREGAMLVNMTVSQLYDAIEKTLLNYRMSNLEGGDGEAYPLVDHLTTPGAESIETGQFEIRLICDDIYNEVLVPAGIAASPVEQHEAAPADVEARFVAEHGHRLAQLLGIASFDIADRDAQIMAVLKCSQPEPPVADERATYVVNSDDLDFEPDGQPHLADMANVGHALLEQINRMLPGYHWNDSPIEVISDLINERDEARASSPNAAGAEGEDEPTEIEQVIACLGDDAATLRHSDEYVEMADNMEAAARLLESLAEDRDADAMCNRWPWERASAQSAEPVAWRELARRLYVELFHCDQQMRSTLDEDGEPHWTQSSVVRNVLADAKAALDASPPPPAPASAPVGLTEEQREAIEHAVLIAGHCRDGYLGDVLNSILATQQPEPRDEATEERPSLTNPLTPYGMLVRALRIVAQTSLFDMGQALLISPAKLSAMEFGREPVTPEIVREVGTYFESLGIHNMRPALQFAVDAAHAGDAS